MNNGIYTDTEAMQTTAKELQDLALMCRNEIDKIYNGHLQNLMQSWTSPSGTAFQTTMDSYKPELLKLPSLVESFAEGTIQVAKSFDQKENDLMNMFNNMLG